MLTAEGGRHHPNIVSSWIDDDDGKLEDKLTDIVVGLAVVSEHESRRWKAEMAQWQRQRDSEEAEARRKAREKAEREERARIAAERKARFDALLGEATAWKQAALIRAYVEARRVSQTSGQEFEEWARWALGEADQIDPMLSEGGSSR